MTQLGAFFRGENKKNGQKFISFAAETETTEVVFREKFNRKPVDLMIGNRVHSGLTQNKSREGFAETEGTYWLVNAETTSQPLALTKSELAQKIVTWDQTGSLQ